MLHSAALEAASMLALLRRGETVENIRSLIGYFQGYRKAVRLYFDSLVARLPVHGTHLRHRVKQAAISEELKTEVKRLLRLGWSHKQIRESLNVGPWCVITLSKEIKASYAKHGRGRRLAAEQIEAIRVAVRAGKRSVQIEREFHITHRTVLKYRREIGDYEDRRRLDKVVAGTGRTGYRGSEERRDLAHSGLCLPRENRDVAQGGFVS
jgi:hypothetical protein